ncbi:MAG: GtrA family protein [Clostridia bacterium]|nr:GtrA family protein [Clostridia bacterium]
MPRTPSPLDPKSKKDQTGRDRPEQKRPQTLLQKLLRLSFSRYALVGVSGVAVDFLTFWLTLGLTAPWGDLGRSLSNAAGMVVGALWCFLLNRSWSFGKTDAPLRRALRYGALLAVNIFLSSALIGWLHRTGLPLALAKLTAQGAIFVWNYFVNRFVVFR